MLFKRWSARHGLISLLKIVHPSPEWATDWLHNDAEVVNALAHTADFSSANDIRCQPCLCSIQDVSHLIAERLVYVTFSFGFMEPLCFPFLGEKCWDGNLARQIPASLWKELDSNYQRKIGLRGSVLGDNEADKGFGFKTLDENDENLPIMWPSATCQNRNSVGLSLFHSRRFRFYESSCLKGHRCRTLFKLRVFRG